MAFSSCKGEHKVFGGTYHNTRHEQFILMSPLWLNGLFQEHLKEKKAEQCFISALGTHTLAFKENSASLRVSELVIILFVCHFTAHRP